MVVAGEYSFYLLLIWMVWSVTLHGVAKVCEKHSKQISSVMQFKQSVIDGKLLVYIAYLCMLNFIKIENKLIESLKHFD